MHLPAGPHEHSDVPFALRFPVVFTRFSQRFPRAVLSVFLLIGVVAAVYATRVKEAEDLLDFIPPDDPDVRVFREVGKTFGALRVALVGIEAKKGEDVFTADAVRRISAATEAIKGVRGVDSVDSFTALEDFFPSEAGVEVRPLIEGPPADEAAHEALRERVLSREHIVGNFVARDGAAALLLVYLADGASDRLVSHEIRRVVQSAIGDLHAVYGGAPFAGSAIYEETQSDIRRLTPLAVLLLLGMILVAFRDLLGVILTILSVAWAVVVVIAGMVYWNEPFTAASATLPVVLFASGTSYAVHVLGRYYVLGADGRAGRCSRAEDAERLVTAVRIVGPPVVIASLTTAAGFVACLVTDIRPMRALGIECASGVLLSMISALLLVPAVLALFPRGRFEPAHSGRVGRIGTFLAAISAWASHRRVGVLAVAAVAALFGGLALRHLEVRMEPRAFFRPGSEPWLAERFLAERFGGSQILQVNLKGDFTDPATLHEVRGLEQYARAVPGVTQANAIVEPLMLINDVMGGGRRLPETRRQVVNLLFFLEGRASLKRLMNEARDQVLVHIRIQGDTVGPVRAIEDYLSGHFNLHPSGPTRETVAQRLRWITRAAGAEIDDGGLARVMQAAKPLGPDDPRLVAARRDLALSLLTGEGELMPRRAPGDRVTVPGAVPLRIEELADAIGRDFRALDQESGRRAQVVALGASPEEGELAWSAFHSRVAARARELAVDDALKLAGPLPPSALAEARSTLGDLFPDQPIAHAAKPLTWALAGEPILERGMSRSVRVNHKKSLVVAWVFVVLFIGFLFRSVRLAVISVIPSAFTMVVLFGATSLFGLRIDVGTSLVTSIATGAGSEFAMQYLWYVRRSTPEDVVRFVGPIMVISTLLIGAGFAVLALGNAQPMRMFGALAALAIVGSGALTFLLVPALLRKADSTRALPEEANA